MKSVLTCALLTCSALASPAFAQTLTTDLSTWQTVAGSYQHATSYGSDGQSLTSLALATGPTLSFGSPVTVATIGTSWATWSGGYAGQVLTTSAASIAVNLAPTTSNFGFFAEPDSFSQYLIQLNLTGGGSVQQLVDGNAGAAFFGWNGGGVSSFTITTTDSNFAFGDFYYSASGVPEPAAWGMLICGFGLAGAAMRRKQIVRVRFAA